MSLAGEKALERADSFRGGTVAAARLRERFLRSEANTSDEETRAQYAEAVGSLEAQYPEIESLGPGGAEAFARERGFGRGAGAGAGHGGRRRPAAGRPPKPAPKPKPAQGKGGPVSQVPGLAPNARRSPAPGRPTPRLDRAVRDTGIPAALEGGTSATMMFLGGSVALALLYLVLSSAERPGSGGYALPGIFESLTRWLHRFTSLKDIVPPGPEFAPGPGEYGAVREFAPGTAGAEALPQLPRRFRTRGKVTYRLPRHYKVPSLGGH